MAGPGSGLGSSYGMGIETAGSYGTKATISRWVPFDSCEIKRAPTYVKGNGLRVGTLVRDKNERKLTNQDATGTLKTAGYYNGLGILFGSLMGSMVTGAPSQQGATTAYKQVHAWSNSWQQSFSIEQGIPDISQAVHNWQSLGVKVSDATFDCTTGQALNCQWSLDCQDHFESSTAITPPVLPTGDPYFAWSDMQVKIGAFGSETKVDGVRKWTGTFKRARDNKRFNAGNVTTNPNVSYAIKDEPVDNGFMDIGGTLETEYLNDTLFENYFQTETPFSLIVVFTSSILAGAGYPYSISFNFPCCYFTGDDPTIAGPDIVKPSMPFEVWNDETHAPATITIVNTDTTL